MALRTMDVVKNCSSYAKGISFGNRVCMYVYITSELRRRDIQDRTVQYSTDGLKSKEEYKLRGVLVWLIIFDNDVITN